MQGSRRSGAFRSAQRPRRYGHGLGGRPLPYRLDLQPRGAALGRRRAQSPDGVERQHGCAEQFARSGPPAPLRALHAQLDRRLRPHLAQGPDPAGYHHAAHDDLRHLQGHGRNAGQLLPPQIRRRYPLGAFSGHYFERHAARRRHDRLCGRDLLRGHPLRAVHLPRAAGRLYGHDLHARCAARLRRTDGGRSRETRSPQQLQHRLDELHAGDHLRRDQEASARFHDGL